MNPIIPPNKAIIAKDLGVRFQIPASRGTDTKDVLIRKLSRKDPMKDIWALRNINFDLEIGQSIGIIGRNGAGKSTLLKVIARVLKPIEGRIIVQGKVFPLLELGAAFMTELSGRENIYLYGNLLGYTNEEITEMYGEIVNFAELEEFIETPVRQYSSGMVARLAFAIATAVQPEILLADEILSVGDGAFREKCMKRMDSYMGSGTSVVFVSHSIEQVKRICQYALWIERGRQVMFGPVNDVCAAYTAA